MKKLTLIQTLKLTAELWAWLAEDPNREKRDWPEWEKLGEMNSECPCCEYSVQKKESYTGHCEECPLLGYAWARGSARMDYCLNDFSPYRLWSCHHGEPALRRKAAKEIYLAAMRARVDLEAKGE